MTNRFFYKCTGCLEVVALPERLAMNYSHSVAVCSSCGQHFEFMGRVHRDRLIQEHQECACDDRCTSARGPSCNCKCGGENHGAGMAGYVTVTTDAGAIPQVTLPSPERAAKSLAQFTEFQAAIDHVLLICDAYSHRRNRGEFFPRGEFDHWLTLRAALRSARKARSHTGRMKTLRSVLSPVAA